MKQYKIIRNDIVNWILQQDTFTIEQLCMQFNIQRIDGLLEKNNQYTYANKILRTLCSKYKISRIGVGKYIVIELKKT